MNMNQTIRMHGNERGLARVKYIQKLLEMIFVNTV